MQRFLVKAGMLLAGVVLLDAVLLEKLFFQVKKIKIGEKGSRQQLKLILITDLHLRKYILWSPFKRVARIINSKRPDLLLIAGDILDHSGKLEAVDRFFSLINLRIRILAIPGNHDHAAVPDIQNLKDHVERFNARLLINETILFQKKGKQLAVTGVDDFIEGNADFAKAIENVGYYKNHILLLHSPLQQERVLKKLAEYNNGKSEKDQVNISYIFAGHNHGGQVRFFNFLPVLPEQSGDYTEGWYNDQKPFLYLSKGFGTSRVPIRFGARSEIVVFTYQL